MLIRQITASRMSSQRSQLYLAKLEGDSRGKGEDISYEKGNLRVYFPVVTCIVMSIVLSLLFYVVRSFMK